ncbi:GNAT family N-acetyltransferase [Glutamicibacter sp.]|uniref:GNAT family N-acetyltransferase n=1 Tax=Glutamicibacter sp. TaxID=1931995 RepID=UPI0028BE20D2|nr:GNAT family N-acetyltransferase [Glutamicibacter sp.]
MQEFLTTGLIASPPVPADLDELYEICSDARVWEHRPSSRHRSPAQTRAMIDAWSAGWKKHGLGTWVVREAGDQAVIGYGGCTQVGDAYWNLGYRFTVAAQGRGFATEIARAAVHAAREAAGELPIIASILEHNGASEAVALKLGMKLAYRGLDRGNPDPSAIRLIYADRPLSFEQLSCIVNPGQ